MSNEPQFEYEIADGKVYIRILMAERKVSQRWDGEDCVHHEDIQGRVRISTDPEWQADTELGYVKVRGRKYGIEHIVKRIPEEYVKPDRLGREQRWQTESSYRSGYRNDRGSQVSYQAKAWDSLRDIETEALELFEKHNPDWAKTSTRKLFEYERNDHTTKAARLRKEAEENDRKAAEWQARIDELGAEG
ncbi:hypothetical protein [Streptomyces asiaticus]|uniref:hypothetical protein n=1 Tax=Streptomyces asiaticus TaxID=114695 RepID=UPI003F663A98